MLDGGADADAKNDGRSKVELNKAMHKIIKMPHDTYIGYYFLPTIPVLNKTWGYLC